MFTALTTYLGAHFPRVYAEDAVPADAPFPFVTFRAEPPAHPLGEGALTLTCWCRGDSAHAERVQAGNALLDCVPTGGVAIPCDAGVIVIHRGADCLRFPEKAGALGTRVAHRLCLYSRAQ